MATLVWLRHELRTFDNPLFDKAIGYNEPIYACYLITPSQWQCQHHSPRRNQYVYQRLIALRQELRELNIPLVVINADDYAQTSSVLSQLCLSLSIKQVIVGEEYGVWERQRDAKVECQLREHNIHSEWLTTQVFFKPGSIVSAAKQQPYKVFTPFANAWRQRLSREGAHPSAAVALATPIADINQGLNDAQLHQLAEGPSDWPVSEATVLAHLGHFIKNIVSTYQQHRDYPNLPATSRLSPALAHGIFSPAQAVSLLQREYADQCFDPKTGPGCWLNELIWREFYIHLLAQFDSISYGVAFKPTTRAIQWDNHADYLTAWQQGKTGIPIVDAGMRQLNAIGWMHNRVRMICASFLCKNLWLDWRLGERYFMEQLIDGHLAANNGGWQWSASTGTDAAPYFRVFNPVSQSQKFDPEGAYIRRWVEELASLAGKAIHQPSEHDCVRLGYPTPIVDLKSSRKRAIEQFAAQTRQTTHEH
ncbi:cryptochrome/photolyase family protein [Celerinatantimonas yamalensis]|uniref:FAD-binding domain-containing protein n=1 Tax=Celerinatantimonas yamalensis TaxID=559956 RepID=A0ABW9G9W8_9GAMM